VISEAGSRIAKNSIYSMAKTVLAVPVTLLITPYIVIHLGKLEFGIWALVGVISSYAQLSDFGITESLIKYMAEFKAQGNNQRLNQLLNTAMVLYVAIGVVFCGFFIAVLPFIVDQVLRIPQPLSARAQYIFTIAIALFFLNMLMGVFGSLIVGFQRMGYSNAISLGSTLATAVGTVFALSHGYGLEGLIFNNALVTVFVIIANTIAAWHLFPELRINPFRYCSRGVLRQIFSFSWKIQISNITQLMIFQVDRVLLSHYVGLAAVSNYEIANRIAFQAKGLVASIFAPMLPAASTLYATDEKDRISGLYRRSFKYMALAAIPFALLVVALAHPFVRTWMGPGYETSAFTMQLLMLAYMLNLLTGPGSFILSGINKPHIGMWSSVFAGITNLLLCLFLVRTIGYYGVIIGIFISIVTSGIFFIWMVHRTIEGLDWRLYPRTLLRPIVLAVLLGGCLMSLDMTVALGGYPLLCLLGAGYLALVLFGLMQGDYFDGFDRAMLAKIIPWKRARS